MFTTKAATGMIEGLLDAGDQGEQEYDLMW